MKLQHIIQFKISILFIVFSITSSFGQETRGDKVWHQGEILLNNNDTLSGLIMYNFRANQITLKNADLHRTFLPNTFKKVNYTSLIDSVQHELVVLEIQTSKNYFRPYFFELEDTTGRIKVYKQYYWEQKTIPSDTFSHAFGYGIRFVLYTVNSRKHAKYIYPKRKYILNLLSDKKNEIKEKVKEERWRYNHPYDIIQIIKFYNSLFI